MHDVELPIISVIMPVFNCDLYVRQAIDSILEQSFKNFELIIVDDSSTDNTWAQVNSYRDQRIVFSKNSKNLGYLQTVNKLFEMCQGQFIAFQDGDDWSDSFRLEKQYKLLCAREDVSFCGTFCTKYYSDDFQLKVRYPVTMESVSRWLVAGRTSLFCGASIMFRSALLQSVGGYRAIFNRIGAEDVDWFLRLLDSSSGVNLPEPLYYYRQRAGSVTKVETQSKLNRISLDLAYAFYLQRLNGGKDRASERIENIEAHFRYLLGFKKVTRLELFVQYLSSMVSLPSSTKRIDIALMFIGKILIAICSTNLVIYSISRKRRKRAERMVEVLKR